MTSSTARRLTQGGFLALTLGGVFVLRANAEAWCPMGGVEALYTYLREGNLLCSLGISNFYALLALLASVLLVRRAFCGYLCPIGTLSQWLAAAGRRWGIGPWRVPVGLDRVLSAGKYLVGAAILLATWQVSELVFRGYCPAYALLGRHGADITAWAYVIGGGVLIASLVISMPFCRWFCPLAAVLNPLSRVGLGRIKVVESHCTHCGRCARRCPMAIPVDQVSQVTAARCLACLKCVEACPAAGEPALVWGPPAWLGRRWRPTMVIGVLLLCASAAVAAACLAPLPAFVHTRGTPPTHVATEELRLAGLTCRGRANLLVAFLRRDDLDQFPGASAEQPGYFRLEAWPDPQTAVVRISFDPTHANRATIQRAITEPYYDLSSNRWWMSPFLIEGYHPPGIDADSVVAP